MDGVDELMKGLKLSDVERKGLKNVGGMGITGAAGGREAVLGEVGTRINGWSYTGSNLVPEQRYVCKELGENIFLFAFRQAPGWRRALEDGPWWFDKELLVMGEYDPEKMAEEYDFNIILPIWFRVYGLPVGSMKREAGEKIGGDICEVLDVDVEPDGTTVGTFLWIKVKLDINKPLMRGSLLDKRDKGGESDDYRRGWQHKEEGFASV